MQKKIKKRYNKAFTLPEVLMTLTIIGVLAIATIPALIQSVEHRDTVVRVQKYQEVLNSAVKRYATENLCVDDLSKCSAFAGNSNSAALNALKPYFSVIKDCGISPGLGCWAKDVMYKTLNGGNLEIIDNIGYAKAVLADGTAIRVGDYNDNCNTDVSYANTAPLLYSCGFVQIDTNGDKGPNQLGRDVFEWIITRQGVYPRGHYDDATYAFANGTPKCNLSVPGYGCTAKILKENAVNY